MTTRALVLGGGGTVGIAWETGVLHALQSAGIAVDTADLIVGTSAGSVVGTQLALGLPLAVLLAMQTAALDPVQDRPAPSDEPVLAAVREIQAQPSLDHGTLLRNIGALALQAAVMPETTYLAIFTLLQGVPWPARRLLIPAVRVTDGVLHGLDSASGATVQQAVAASCAVPGIFPTVTINQHQYMDGGMASGTNAELASDCDAILIIAPLTAAAPDEALDSATQLGREVATLRAAGRQVAVIVPDAEALTVFGPSMMDTTRRIEAAHAGVRQGSAAAERVRAIWNEE